MLKLDTKAHAVPEAFYAADLPEARSFGQSGRLNLLLVESGGCGLPGAGAVLAAGAVVAAAGPVALRPVKDCALLGAVLGGGAARQLVGQLTGPVVYGPAPAKPMRELMHQMERMAPGDGPAQSALAYALVCALAQARPQALPPLVEAAIAHMRARYDEVYGVEELAAELGVSKSYLIRSFTAAMGTPPGRYLTWVRLEAARQFLPVAELSLDAVAGMCGFSSGNYLCRVFKKEFGLTPTAWRTAFGRQAPPPAQQDEKLKSVYL